MRKDKVLCLVKTMYTPLDEEELWLQDEPTTRWDIRKEYILPLYNHPHNDLENGQKEVHYHQDDRYGAKNIRVFNSFKAGRIRLPLMPGETLEFRFLYKIQEAHTSMTPVSLIQNSKLKHKCIHKGKCPHRGFDLTNIEPINGVITCPLHSLKFDSTTKKLIKNG